MYALVAKGEAEDDVTPEVAYEVVVACKQVLGGVASSYERLVAGFFGTKRVPLSGSNSGHNTNSDSMHDELYIECKVREKFAIWSLFDDTEKKAKNENKIPIVALKQKGEKGFLLVIRPENLEKIAEIHKKVVQDSK